MSDSLLGEYARMLLVATAACSAATWAIQSGSEPIAPWIVIGNIVAMAAAVTNRVAGLFRILILLAFAISIARMIGFNSTAQTWLSPLPFFSPAMLLACLALLAIRDCVAVVRNWNRSISLRTLAWMSFATGLVGYMIVIPSVDAFLEQFRQRPSSYTIEELTAFEQLRIRSAKFAVFAVFTYFGACVASFINVVAASAPRGESIAFRSSACPKCETPIRRIDNVPIIGYLNLGGRCRACAAVIPVRYFIVEVVGASIFGSLFLCELVTGAANVPGASHYHYAGILWIILYTKWPVVGIYFYHAAMFSCLLMLALMDLDRLRCPKWLAWSMVIVFATLPIAIATLRPIVFDDQLPLELSRSVPSWLVHMATSMLGGVAGWTLATLVRRYASKRILGRSATTSLPLAAMIVGVTLGWQATVTITLLCFIVVAVFRTVRRWYSTRKRIAATSLLLTVATLHHPAWKWLAGLW